ncbi:MAG: sensor histidine kinase [Cyclobacteriaceae bacterium]|nr:sensor histidine kinase [Cyclobacteriaceae bacterium]
MKHSLWIIWPALLLLSYSGYSTPIVLSDGKGQYEVLGKWPHLEDASRLLTVSDIQDRSFVSSNPSMVPTMGFSHSAWWFKGTLRNETVKKNWILEIGYAPLDLIEVYYQDNHDHTWKVLRSGDQLPISARPIKYRNPIFLVPVPAGTAQDIYIRIESTSSIQVPITIWDNVHFYDNDSVAQFANGIFYGIMIIMALYQLFLYFSIKDSNALLYTFTLVSGMNVVAFFQGYGFLYLYPEIPSLNIFFSSLSGPLFILFSTLLTRSFLNLRQLNIWLDKALIFNTSLVLVIAISTVLLYPRIRMSWLHISTFLHCTIVLLSAFYCWRKNYRPARYFLIAWVTLLFAGALFSLKNLGFIPANIVTNGSLYVGGIVQTMLMALALGDRVNLLIRENEIAKEREFRIEQNAKNRLEAEVRLRTNEIVMKNQQLHESDQFKNKLFSILSHDVKAPLNSLRGSLRTLQMGAITEEEFKSIAMKLEQQLDGTNSFIENLLQWTRNQLDGEVMKPGVINLQDLVSEIIVLMHDEWIRKNIRIQNHVRHPLMCYADSNMVKAVIRNIFSNAIKFSVENGTITFEAENGPSKVSLSITDSGIGIPPENQLVLFTPGAVSTPGTMQERGTGLGLVLCREFIEKNHGTIWYTPRSGGGGSTFGFSLPARP